MPSVITSPNMNLPIPTVGVDTGPDYANNIDACLTILDQHNHSPGLGVQITPNGLNINSDLQYNDNNIIGLRSVRFYPQIAPLGLVTDIGVLYEAGPNGDLYYNDGGGTQIRITQSGSVTGASGTITGLPSGTAGVSFSAGVFAFSATSSEFADINVASVILSNHSPLSKQLTLQPPNAMGADYSVTLPPPNSTGQLAFMTYDTSNNMAAGPAVAGGLTTANLSATAGITAGQLAVGAATGNIAAGTLTRAQQVSVGQQVSSTCGNFVGFQSTWTDITNLTITITTTGRPVMLMCQSDGLGSGSYFRLGSSNSGYIRWLRDATETAQTEVQATDNNGDILNNSVPLGSLNVLDVIGAGTYTYKLQYKMQTFGNFMSFLNAVILAYEL